MAKWLDIDKVHEKSDIWPAFLTTSKTKLLIIYSWDLCTFMGLSSLHSDTTHTKAGLSPGEQPSCPPAPPLCALMPMEVSLRLPAKLVFYSVSKTAYFNMLRGNSNLSGMKNQCESLLYTMRERGN